MRTSFATSALALVMLAGATAPVHTSQAASRLSLRCNVDAPNIQFVVAPPCPNIPRYVPEDVIAHVFIAQLEPSHSYSFIWTNCASATASCSRRTQLSSPTTVSVLVTDNTTGEQQSLSITLEYSDLQGA